MTDEFAAELGDLYKAAVVTLPTMAGHFKDAVAQIPGEDLEWMHRRPAGIGAGELGPYPDWLRVMKVLEQAATKTSTALIDVGEAAELHVNDTIQAEGVVSSRLEARMKKLDETAKKAGL